MTDPRVTVVALHTDTTTILERLALYEIKEDAKAERSGIF
jgi:hypothetical protein